MKTVLLGVAIIGFSTSPAMGAEKTVPHKASPNQNNLSIMDQEQKNTGDPLKALLKKVHDATQNLLSQETDKTTKSYIKSLQLELKKKISFESLTALQTIYFLKDIISKKNTSPYKRYASIRLMGELLIEYTPSDTSKVLEVIDLLINKFSNQTANPFERYASIQVMGELLKKYTLPNTSKALEIIDLLRKINTDNSYIRISAVQVIGELLIKYPPSPLEISKTLHLFQTQLSLKQKTNSHIRRAIIKATEKILKHYSLPEKEVSLRLHRIKEISLILHRIKENLFHENMYVRQDATQAIVSLLKIDRLFDTETKKVILWITEKINDGWWRNRISALVIFNEFLKQNILSDPDDKKEIAVRASDKLTDPNWEVRKEAVLLLGNLLSQSDIPLDPEEKTTMAFMIEDRITDNNERVQIEAIEVLGNVISHQYILFEMNDRQKMASTIAKQLNKSHPRIKQTVIKTLATFLEQQNISLDSDDIKKLIVALPDLLIHSKWEVRKEAVKAAEILLSQADLSPPERLEIIYEIAPLIFDEISDIRQVASRIIKNLWASDFPLPEKIKIKDFLANEAFSDTPTEKTEVLNVLRAAIQADLPFEPETKLMVYLEREKQVSTETLTEENTACEESMISIPQSSE